MKINIPTPLWCWSWPGHGGAASGRPAALVRGRHRLCRCRVGLAAVHPVAGGVCAALPARAAGGGAACRPAGYQQAAGRLHGAGRCGTAGLRRGGGQYGPVCHPVPEVLSGSCPVWAAWADLLLPIFAGAWLLNYAMRAFSGFGLQRQRLGSSLLAGAVPLVFLWRLIWRFQFAPASLCRMPCTLRVLSAAAALLLAVVLIKIFSCAGSALRAYALRGGDGCVPALHRTGTAPDPV